MRALADRYEAGRTEYGTISPTYSGTPEPLAAQAPGFLDNTSVFTGCPAGHTFFTSTRTAWRPCARSAARTPSTS